MKDIGKCKKWRILAYISVLGMLFACADQMLLDNENPAVRQAKNKNQELTVSVARQWFESKYTPVVPTRSVDGTERLQKPYWEKAKEHNRKRYEVVETPILSQGVHVVMDRETAAYWESGMKSDFIRNTIRMVVLRDKKKGTTRSFIMTFVGTLDYLKKTRTIGKNSYLYRQPDFSGSVLFHELDGTFMNGWRYSEGKIVATLSAISNDEQQAMDTLGVQTRAEVEVCYESCFPVFEDDCTYSYVETGDLESGIVLEIEENCVPKYKGDDCVTDCYWEDDGSDDEEEDDWWNDPYPPGGAGNETNPTNPFDYTKVKSCKNLTETQKVIPSKLKELGIDLEGIKLTENIECKSNAKRTKDGSEIQVCTQFYGRDVNDQVSIIYHEIYHIRNDVNSDTDWDSKLQNLNSIRYFDTPPDNLMNYLRALHIEEYNSSHSSGTSLDEYIKYTELMVATTLPPEYYLNDINAYTNEIETVKNVTDSYSIEREYGLWLHQQKYKIAIEEYK